jgi:prepilin-type N-terminal cleavage/methylation domain-containing protein/prepilin-type processing-associated H-X9-DG protein
MTERRSSPRRRAFTLIELLVVVAIIALLIAMLMPSMDKARGASRMIKCQTILRQIAVASSFYSAEFHDYFLPQSVPGAIPGSGPYHEWFQMPHFQRSLSIPVPTSTRPVYNTPAGLICPDARWVLNNPGTNEGKYTKPAATPPAGQTLMYRLDLTYGHNASGLPGWTYQDGSSQAANVLRAHRHSKMRAPGARMFFMDALWSDPQHGGSSALQDNPRWRYYFTGENFEPTHGTSSTYWAIAWRHMWTPEQGITNALFFDGHVEAKTAGLTGDLNDRVLWHVYGY